MIDIIQTSYTPGKVKKILEGQEPAPQFYNKAFGKYNAVVEEGLNTATQKQMQFAQLLQLRAAGVPIPEQELLEASTLQNKKQLIEAIEREKQQAAQQQQMQLQAQLEEQKAKIKLSNARAMADEGLGMERVSRIQENQALALERRAAAVKDEEIGMLNLIKSLKELEGIDLAHIEKLLSLANLIKAQEAALTQQNPAPTNVVGS